MEQFANDTPELRDEAFQETAAQLGMSKAIIEKDFWVFWSLFTLRLTVHLSDFIHFWYLIITYATFSTKNV